MDTYSYNFIGHFTVLLMLIGFLAFLFLISNDFRKFRKRTARYFRKLKKRKHKIEYHI
jgi:hypothetical protein